MIDCWVQERLLCSTIRNDIGRIRCLWAGRDIACVLFLVLLGFVHIAKLCKNE